MMAIQNNWQDALSLANPFTRDETIHISVEAPGGLKQALCEQHPEILYDPVTCYPGIRTLHVIGELNEDDFAWLNWGMQNLSQCTLNCSHVPQNAFIHNTSLRAIELPNATSIGEWAFGNCIYLRTAELPRVKTVSSHAFHGCVSLASLKLPSALHIRQHAFEGCERLTTLSMPRARSIAGDAFVGCPRALYRPLG